MINLLTQLLILILAHLVPLLFIYLEVPMRFSFVLIAALVVILIFLQKFVFTTKQSVINAAGRWLFLFSGSLFVELLVVATGGFYSSFFVLLHFYALGLGFFIGLRIATVFILLSAVSLLLQILIDPRLKLIMTEDSGSLILYLLSYFIIIPFSYYLAQQFQIKDKLTRILEKEVQTDKLILQEISEMILVTNLKLTVLSVNEVVEKVLKMTRSELIGKQIFDILFLRTNDGKLINPQALLIDQLIADKNIKTIENLNLFTKNSAQPTDVHLSIRFVPDLTGSVEQLSFIIKFSDPITQPKISSSTESLSLKKIYEKEQIQLEDLRNRLISDDLSPLANQLFLIENWTQDIVLLREINRIKLDKNFQTIDLAQFLNNVVGNNQKSAKHLNVTLTFQLLHFTQQDIAAHVPAGINVSLMDMTSLFFRATINVSWFDVLIHKLIFMSTLLSLSSPQKHVQVSIERYDENVLKIKVSILNLIFDPDERHLLFMEGYGSLTNTTSLYFSSGIEGFLAQKIARDLDMVLDVAYLKEQKELSFELFIDKRKNM